MNIWGKVLAFLIILSGGGAFVLSTQLLDFRHSWVKQVEANTKRLAEVRLATANKRRELAQLQADYERLMLGWDIVIQNNVTAAVPAADSLQLSIGPPQISESKDKDGNTVLPLVYAFKPDAAGKYVYVGEFRAERLAVGNSTFKATLSLPDDPDLMQPGQNWRIRTRIPASDKLSFLEFSRRFLLLEEDTIAKENELKELTDVVAPKIESNLANREDMVRGSAALQGQRGKLPDVLIDGQLPTLTMLEEARNAVMAQADLIRHQLNRAVTEFEKLNSENSQAARKLSPPKPDASPSVTKR